MCDLSPESSEFIDIFLQASTVPNYVNCIVIGSFDTKKTIATQLNRSAVLAFALSRKLTSEDARFAVIGGGFAGIMASNILLRLNRNVTLFETGNTLIPLQNSCSDRYIHPNSYDWPIENIQSAYSRSGIDWSADYAYKVCSDVTDCFSDVVKDKRVLYSENMNCSIRKIEPDTSRPGTLWRLTDDSHYQHGPFDGVLFAIGFGPERIISFGNRIGSYWRNSELDYQQCTEFNKKRILFSGSGDGSLVSIIYAIFRTSNHSDLISIAEALLNDELKDKLIESERGVIRARREGQVANIVRIYDEIFRDYMSVIRDVVARHKKRDVTVDFNTSQDGIFTPNSSVLNRFLVYALFRSQAIRLRTDRLSASIVQENFENGIPKYQVNWNDEVVEYDDIIARHGVTENYVRRRIKPEEFWSSDQMRLYTELELQRSIPSEVFAIIDQI